MPEKLVPSTRPEAVAGPAARSALTHHSSTRRSDRSQSIPTLASSALAVTTRRAVAPAAASFSHAVMRSTAPSSAQVPSASMAKSSTKPSAPRSWPMTKP